MIHDLVTEQPKLLTLKRFVVNFSYYLASRVDTYESFVVIKKIYYREIRDFNMPCILATRTLLIICQKNGRLVVLE